MDQLDRSPERSEKRKEKVCSKLSLLAGGIVKHDITIHIPVGVFMQELEV